MLGQLLREYHYELKQPLAIHMILQYLSPTINLVKVGISNLFSARQKSSFNKK